MMNRSVSRIFVALSIYGIVSGCASRPGGEERPLFLYQELQDSVEVFVKEMSLAFPADDSLSLPVFSNIRIELYRGDTLILVSPANASAESIPMYLSARDTVIGAGMLGGRVCEIVFSGDDAGVLRNVPSLIDNSCLTVPRCDYDLSAQVSKETLLDCNYLDVSKAARLKRTFILDRPNHLKRYGAPLKRVEEPTSRVFSQLLSTVDTSMAPCYDYERLLTTFIQVNYRQPASKKDLIAFYQQRNRFFGHLEEDRRYIRFLQSRRVRLVSNENESLLYDREGDYAYVSGSPCTWNRMKHSDQNYGYDYTYPVFFDKKGAILYDLCMQNLYGEDPSGEFNIALGALIKSNREEASAAIQDIDSESQNGRVAFFLEYKGGQLHFLCGSCFDSYNLHRVFRDGSISSERLQLRDLEDICAPYFAQISESLTAFCKSHPEVRRIIFRVPLFCR